MNIAIRLYLPAVSCSRVFLWMISFSSELCKRKEKKKICSLLKRCGKYYFISHGIQKELRKIFCIKMHIIKILFQMLRKLEFTGFIHWLLQFSASFVSSTFIIAVLPLPAPEIGWYSPLYWMFSIFPNSYFEQKVSEHHFLPQLKNLGWQNSIHTILH